MVLVPENSFVEVYYKGRVYYWTAWTAGATNLCTIQGSLLSVMPTHREEMVTKMYPGSV